MYEQNKDDGAYEFIDECEGCGQVTALEPEAHLCVHCISDCDNTDVKADMNYELLCEKYFD